MKKIWDGLQISIILFMLIIMAALGSIKSNLSKYDNQKTGNSYFAEEDSVNVLSGRVLSDRYNSDKIEEIMMEIKSIRTKVNVIISIAFLVMFLVSGLTMYRISIEEEIF